MRDAESRLMLTGRTLAVAGWIVLAVWWGGCRPHGLARSLNGRQPASTELAPGDELTQTMVVNAPGFDAVTVFPIGDDSAGSGMVAFDVIDPASGSSVLPARHRAPLDIVSGRSSYTVRFPAIERSQGRRYALRIRFESRAGSARARFASFADDAYGGGTLFVRGTEQWGDLKFDIAAEMSSPIATVTRTAVSPHSRAGSVLSAALFLAMVAVLSALASRLAP